MSNSATHSEHVNAPQVKKTASTTFSMLQIVEALNTVYPDLKIDFQTVRARHSHEPNVQITTVELEWTEK